MSATTKDDLPGADRPEGEATETDVTEDAVSDEDDLASDVVSDDDDPEDCASDDDDPEDSASDDDDFAYDEAPDRVKKKKSPVLLIFCLILCAAAVFGGIRGGQYFQARSRLWLEDLAPVAEPGEEEILFTLESGWSLSRTAEILYYSGLIRSADSFVRLGKQEGKAESIKAGRFLLSPSMSSAEILEALVMGSVLTRRFTIPEGYTLRQVAKVFADKGIAEQDEFWQSVRDGVFAYSFLDELPRDEHRLEGYLFPDTYEIELDEPVETVIDRMLKRFEEVLASIPPSDTDLSDRELLTLASIIQNEIRLDDERPTAASVFLNRLEQNILLQSDATVQYYFDEPKYPLLIVDTQIDFPYNTYLYPGLPPGPVCAPGKASLEAAMHPDDTTYLYFMAKEDGSGGSYFSRTLSEHNQAVAQSRANRAAR